MRYIGLDIHTKNIVYTVISDNGTIIDRGKIDNKTENNKNF